MQQALPRTSFNSSGLVRLLADLAVAEAAEAKQSFAERLGLWLDFIDAIALAAALNAGAAGGVVARALAGVPVGEALARVRTALIDSITTGKARVKLPAAGDGAADYSAWRRYYVSLQRDMEASIAPLRAEARAALAAQSPALARLATLDAALDKALGERERNLLAGVPGLLEKRFAQLRQAHLATLAATDAAEDQRPGEWLARFGKDMQNVLLAELDVRLQPVIGLIEALGNEVTQQQ